MILNFSNLTKKENLILDRKKTNLILEEKLKLGSSFSENLVQELNLKEHLGIPLTKVLVKGASTISGAPLRKYVNSYNPIKEKLSYRKKKLKVHPTYITNNVSVLDLVVLNQI